MTDTPVTASFGAPRHAIEAKVEFSVTMDAALVAPATSYTFEAEVAGRTLQFTGCVAEIRGETAYFDLRAPGVICVDVTRSDG